MDDELNILPTSTRITEIQPLASLTDRGTAVHGSDAELQALKQSLQDTLV